MSANEDFAAYVGSWKGTNKLYLSWLPDPVKESESSMTVSLKANGQFVEFDYTWAYEGEHHEGVILLGCDTKSDAVQTVWTDSWHSRHVFMVSDGNVGENGEISVKGYYKVEGHPDWGWRTEIVPAGESLRISMFNVSPEGVEEPAVDTIYFRT